MRLFIAADLPDAVRAAISEQQKRIAAAVGRGGSSLRWVKPEHAHLTLARWRESRPADRSRALDAAPRGVVARARIEGATLYQSRLSPSGPAYTPLARATLTA